MTNRPDTRTLAAYSYYLALASAGVMMLSLLLGLIPGRVIGILQNVIWLVVITSALGTFCGFAARSDLKLDGGSEEDRRNARVGLRVNLAALIVMLLMVVFVVVLNLLPGIGA